MGDARIKKVYNFFNASVYARRFLHSGTLRGSGFKEA